MLKDKFVLGVSSLVAMTIIVGAFLSSSRTIATSTSAQATVNVAEACTMSSTLTTPHSATIPNGTYQADIGTTTINVICNDSQGYAIYAVGYTGDEIGGENSTKLVNATGNANTIATGTATSGNTSNWAMKISTSGSSFVGTIDNSFGNYHAVPNEYTKVAHYNSATDAGNNATGSTYQTTYATFVSSTQLAGNYAGKVKYTMVHPAAGPAPVIPLAESDCPAYKICYAPNANNIVGSMSSVSSTTISTSPTAGVQEAGSNGTYVLIAQNYFRSGYGFAGWSTDFEATSNSKIYGPNESITTSTSGVGDADVSSHGLILYPVWIASEGTIQNWSDCNNLIQAPSPSTSIRATLSSITALTDNRDGNVYTVARLADGKCWMIENLRLEDKNSTDASLAQGYGDDIANNHGKFIGLAHSEDANFDSNTTANSIYSTDASTAINIGIANNPAYRIPRYNKNNTNMASGATNSDGIILTDSYKSNNNHVRWYGYGNYYNWPAAIANTAYVNTANQSVEGTSLCPTGWHLPKGGNKTNEVNNEFWNLIVTYLNNGTRPVNYDSATFPSYSNSDDGSNAVKLLDVFPNNFVYPGYMSGSSINNRSFMGIYWSSTATDDFSSYTLDLGGTILRPGNYFFSKNISISVRCVNGT